ncbi:MAG: hypothetical protein TU35_008935 [Thermoproteus sp. AZ2]|jgi:hypothetical protein|uniref:Uncharacterized protein n=1 Tax=Thermoproteus sp. AZ2 TaxID=1609232 RepID=A0ACC6V2N9_9CREN|nr:MAG: hypothetical protein TU35_08165 [Thermoproteus sp. AZ2]
MGPKKERVNIAVARDVAEELAKLAEAGGMTQFALASELLRTGIDLMKSGYASAQVKELVRFYKIMTELEIVPIPGRLLDRLLTDMYKLNKDAVLNAWCEAGRALAGYIKALFGDLSAAVSLLPLLSKIVPVKRFDVRVADKEAVIEIVGIGYGIESVEANAAAAKCLLEDFGYKITEQVVALGVIKIVGER